MFGSEEKVAIDYTTRKREVPKKHFFRCPRCGEIGLRAENPRYYKYRFTHKIYDSNRIEGCIIPKDKGEINHGN